MNHWIVESFICSFIHSFILWIYPWTTEAISSFLFLPLSSFPFASFLFSPSTQDRRNGLEAAAAFEALETEELALGRRNNNNNNNNNNGGGYGRSNSATISAAAEAAAVAGAEVEFERPQRSAEMNSDGVTLLSCLREIHASGGGWEDYATKKGREIGGRVLRLLKEQDFVRINQEVPGMDWVEALSRFEEVSILI